MLYSTLNRRRHPGRPTAPETRPQRRSAIIMWRARAHSAYA